MPLLPTILARYPRRTFIETGTDTGAGVRLAMDAGYLDIHTIEQNVEMAARARRAFAVWMDRVTVWRGDSAEILPHLLAALRTPAFVWLDAHGDCVPTGPSPVRQELRALAQAPCREHVIAIDDLRMFRQERYLDPATGQPIRVGDLYEDLQRVNPHYTLTLEDAYEPQDILLAVLPA